MRGFPKEIDKLPLHTRVRLRQDRPLVPIRALIGTETADDLEADGSPNPKEVVLSIEGEIVGGHSGAPLLNSQSEVIGVGNGGLGDGIGWCIQYSKIEFTPLSPALQSRINRLRMRKVKFTTDSVLREPIQLNEVKDSHDSARAYASAKVSFVESTNKIQVDIKAKVRQTGIAGTGHTYASVVFLDAIGNTIAETGNFHVQQGADFSGNASKEDSKTYEFDGKLTDQIARAVLIVKARDSSDFGALGPLIGDFISKAKSGEALPTNIEILGL